MWKGKKRGGRRKQEGGEWKGERGWEKVEDKWRSRGKEERVKGKEGAKVEERGGCGPSIMLSSWIRQWLITLRFTYTAHHTGRPTRAPFTRQRSGLPHELAHCVIPEWGQLMLRCLLLLAYLLAFTYFSDQFDRDAALALISPTWCCSLDSPRIHRMCPRSPISSMMSSSDSPWSTMLISWPTVDPQRHRLGRALVGMHVTTWTQWFARVALVCRTTKISNNNFNK